MNGSASFGVRVRAARMRARLTQEQLASAAGVTVSTVRNWEIRDTRPGMDTLLRLADAVKVSIDWLLARPGANDTSPSDADLAAAEEDIRHAKDRLRRLEGDVEALEGDG